MKTFIEFYNELEGTIIDEKLSVLGRRKLKRAAKKNKLKLKIARKKAKTKSATPAVLKKRAARQARAAMKRTMFGTMSGRKLNNTMINRMQTMVNARSGQLDVLRRSLLKGAIEKNRKR